jgi:hypothetical protein
LILTLYHGFFFLVVAVDDEDDFSCTICLEIIDGEILFEFSFVDDRFRV